MLLFPLPSPETRRAWNIIRLKMNSSKYSAASDAVGHDLEVHLSCDETGKQRQPSKRRTNRAQNGLSSAAIRTLVAGLVVLLPWTFVTSFGWVKPIILPSPWAVLNALGKLLVHQNIWVDIVRTVGRVAAALVISVAVGVPAGLWLGYQRKLYRLIEGPVHALRSLPSAALFPLFLIVIGVDEGSIIALATYNSVLVVLINTIAGASLANRHRLYQAQLLRLNGWQITKDILFWEALP